jgi:O-antigen/teichoic acid export membrane protein
MAKRSAAKRLAQRFAFSGSVPQVRMRLAMWGRSIQACTGLLIPVFGMTVLSMEQYSSAIHISRIAEASAKLKGRLQGRIDQMMVRFTASAFPASFSLGCLAPVIIRLFYGTELTSSAPELMIYGAAEGFLWALSLLLIELSMTLGYGSACETYMLIAFCFEAVIMWFLPYRLGLAGFALAAPLALCVLCFLCMSKISNRRDISFVSYAVKCLRILLASMAMNGVYALAEYFGILTLSGSPVITFLILAGVILIAGSAGMFILSLSGIRVADSKKSSKKKKGTAS